MSNVFRRFHEPTGVEFWDNLVEVEKLLTRFLMNDKNVPKSYRYIYTIPILERLGREWDWIVKAQSIFPGGERANEMLNQKKDALQNAIAANEAIIQALQRMVFILQHIDLDKMDELGKRLIRESAMLRSAKKNCRIQNNSKQKKQS